MPAPVPITLPAQSHPQSKSKSKSQSQSQSQSQSSLSLSLSPVPVPAQASPVPAPPRRGRNSHPSRPGGVSDTGKGSGAERGGEGGRAWRQRRGPAMDCEAKKGKKVRGPGAGVPGGWWEGGSGRDTRGYWDEGPCTHSCGVAGRGGIPTRCPPKLPKWCKFGVSEKRGDQPLLGRWVPVDPLHGCRGWVPGAEVSLCPLSLPGLCVTHQASGFPQSGSEAGAPQQRLPAATTLGAPLSPRLPD